MARNFKELRRSVLLGAYPPLPPFYSEELGQVIKILLQLNPDQRPTSAELLRHPIIVKKIKKFLEGKPGLGKLGIIQIQASKVRCRLNPETRSS